MWILQGPAVSYRGQVVAAVVAETLETAREARRHVRVEYREDETDVEFHPGDRPVSATPGQRGFPRRYRAG
jgi:xanthine dehydrogenase YagR molybdenum-binding subunit